MDKELTVPKWVLNSSTENTPNTLKIFQPKKSAQAHKLEIYNKKIVSLWVSVFHGFINRGLLVYIRTNIYDH